MLTKKSVDIFDVEKIKPGYFISYSETLVNWEMEDGEEVPVYDETEPYNELIKEVSEKQIITLNIHGRTTTISISDLFSDDPEEPPKYKILGIKESAI